MAEKNRKILFFQPSLLAGGAERFSLDLALELKKRGYRVSFLLFVKGGFFLEEALAHGFQVKVLKKRWKLDFLNSRQIKKAIRLEAPDLIFSRLGGNIYAPYLSGKIPVLAVEDNVNKNEGFLKTKLKTLAYKKVSEVVAVSEAVKKDLQQRYKLKAEKIKVIYNGLEFSRFKTYFKEKNSVPIIGSVGRLEKQKNYELLIRALAQVQGDFICQIVGEGSKRKFLENLISELSLEKKVFLVGLKKDIGQFLSSLDFFVLPSRWEGLGIVLLEAGYYSLPVVASAVDGITEVLSDRTAYLFRSEDQLELEKKIQYLLDNRESFETKNKGALLREDVINRFSLSQVADSYEKLIKTL